MDVEYRELIGIENEVEKCLREFVECESSLVVVVDFKMSFTTLR